MEGGRNGGREGLKERGGRALLFMPVNWPIFTHQLPKGPSGTVLGTKDTKMMRCHSLFPQIIDGLVERETDRHNIPGGKCYTRVKVI